MEFIENNKWTTIKKTTQFKNNFTQTCFCKCITKYCLIHRKVAQLFEYLLKAFLYMTMVSGQQCCDHA